MPIYEYRCRKCGHVTELWQGFDDPAPEACSECGAQVEKVFHPPGIVFKGTGFYVTDYGRPSQKRGGQGGDGSSPNGSQSEKSETPAGGKDSETKGGAKSDKTGTGGSQSNGGSAGQGT